jgi:hypothetical protein
MRGGIVEKQGEALKACSSAPVVELLQIGVSIPDLADFHRSVELDPGGGTG